MTDTIRIGPVPWFRRARALKFLVAGNGDEPFTTMRANALWRVVSGHDRNRTRLWWARRARQCLAAAMVISSPGRAGMLFHSPSQAAGVDRDALRRLIDALTAQLLAQDLALVQAMVQPGGEADAETLADAGYRHLAQLVSMRLLLPEASPAAPCDGNLTWRHYGEFGDAELAQLLGRTYAGSLDCPLLSGTRSMEEVIRGHKVAGTFVPELWWIAFRGGTPMGCVLVNDADADNSDVIYMGVAAAHRGQGLGRALMHRAIEQARGRGKTGLFLAVDAANTYAMKLYESLGFRSQSRREAYVRLANDAKCPWGGEGV